MSVKPRGGQWQADVKVGANSNPTGKEVRIRLSAPTKIAAEQLEAEARASIIKTGSYTPEESSSKRSDERTVEAALKKTWTGPNGGWSVAAAGENQKRNVELCIAVLGKNRAVRSITAADFEKLDEQFRKQGNSNDTIRQKVQAFHRVLKRAMAIGWIDKVPHWERPTPGVPRDFVFSATQEADLIKLFRDIKLEPDLADLIKIGIETGCRMMELVDSIASMWRLDDKIVALPGVHPVTGKPFTKYKKSRNVTLTDEAIEIMKRRLEGLKPTDKPLPTYGYTKISERFKWARKMMGFEGYKDFTFHALRHTRATRLAAQTGNPFLLMSQLGHKDIKTSMRYIQMAAIDFKSESWRNGPTMTAFAQAAE